MKQQKPITMKHTLILFALYLVTLLPFNLVAQKTWNFSPQPQYKTASDTGCPVYNYGDPELTFEYEYALGGEGNNTAIDIAFSPDSTHFMILYANNGSNFAKYNQAGEQVWNHKLMVNDTTDFFAKQFIPIGSDYYISGFWGDYKERKYGIYKIDSFGRKMWLKKIYDETATLKLLISRNPSIIKVEGINFLVSTKVNDDLLIAKFDSSCNKIWELSHDDLNHHGGSSNFDILYANGFYLVYLKTQYWWIDKLATISDFGFLVEDTHARIYYEKAKLYACGHSSPDQWIKKYDLNFNLKKEYKQPEDKRQRKIYGAVSIKELEDWTPLLFYDFEYDGTGLGDINYNVQLLHLDKNLNCKSTINIYAPGSQYSNKLLIDKNGDYILYGHGYHEYSGRNMLMLIKIKKCPLPVVENKTEPLIKVEPNPANNFLEVNFNNAQTGWLKIYSQQGRLLYSKTITNSNYTPIDISELPSGILLLQFSNNNSNILNKIIKL